MKSNAILEMQIAVKNYIRRNLPKVENKAVSGLVQGERVIVGNNSYPYIPTVDLYFGDGDRVACILPDSGDTAAIVGVF